MSEIRTRTAIVSGASLPTRTQVAQWAGHSVHVLLKIYASCIDGQDEAARKRIEGALGTEPTEGPESADT
ncbi:hypothetical protein [Micromonospora sp. NPDC051141]|uniref:hypothetical protein n=1 Tax=Micromonospora sp. NPDC051141 TaxID=3364284 RepID=UPI00379343DF